MVFAGTVGYHGAAVQGGQAAVVEGDLTLTTQATAAGRAEIISYAAEAVTVRTNSQEDALLVLSDTAYPGWQARVDGVSTPIYTTNFLFRGVRVPAGEHEVRFVYAPASWRWGLAVSGIALVLWLGLVVVSRYAKARTE